ncbi:MAG: hypothetical protein IPK98_10910 [Chloracidobacterium sp.]|nr:hypothetical protein [Chloracidobacterium sp.]
MTPTEPTFLTKLNWNLPWLVRYPVSRLGSMLEQTAFEKKHIIITVANHFEPAWSEGGMLDHKAQIASQSLSQAGTCNGRSDARR